MACSTPWTVTKNEDTLFSGIINQRVLNTDKEFIIDHADKTEQFLKRFRELMEEKNFKTHVEHLMYKSKESGPKDERVSKFQILYTEIM